MELYEATQALSALAQESRLAAFRLLVRAGERGLPSGDIADALAIPHNTLSTHLAILTRAGLLASQRAGRSILYRINFDGTRSLLAFLLEDCCQGAPDACGLALGTVLPNCCSTP